MAMRVLQVSCGGLGNGGVQSVIMSICTNIPGIQFDILLFTNEKRYYDDAFKHLGGEILRIPNYEGKNKLRRKVDYCIRFPRIFFYTYRLLKKEKNYDVIHCHNDFESGICNIAAFFAGVKIRISHAHTSHNKFPRYNIFAYIYGTILQRLMNLSTNRKIGCTEEAFESIFGVKYLNKPNTYVIPNPIEIERFTKKNRHIGDQTKINIVHVGRYDENKNQLFIIDMLPYIIQEIPNVRLQLVGSGNEYRSKLLSRIEELNLKSYVELLPSNSDVKELLEYASAFIFPSKYEGFGIALLEAQAMEVPCLVSNTIPKIVDCGLCIFLSLSDKKEIWANKTINMIRKKYNLKLDRYKLNSFDVKHYVNKINNIYNSELI